MWKERIIDLGKIKVGSTNLIEFEHLGDIEVNKDYRGNPDIEVSCGCTSATVIGNRIRVNYTPTPIPKHILLEGRDFYKSSKQITVAYTDIEGPKKETLIFNAIVIK